MGHFANLDVLVVTGGHVAVLVNRLRLFGIGDLCRDKHLICSYNFV